MPGSFPRCPGSLRCCSLLFHMAPVGGSSWAGARRTRDGRGYPGAGPAEDLALDPGGMGVREPPGGSPLRAGLGGQEVSGLPGQSPPAPAPRRAAEPSVWGWGVSGLRAPAPARSPLPRSGPLSLCRCPPAGAAPPRDARGRQGRAPSPRGGGSPAACPGLRAACGEQGAVPGLQERGAGDGRRRRGARACVPVNCAVEL